MNLFRKKQPINLSEWLEIATKKLAKTARERVTREIESHYREAVAAHLSRGESEDAAQAAALRELGEAKAAAKRLRRTNITQREERRLLRLEKMSGSKGRLIFVVVYFSFLGIVNLPYEFHGVGYFLSLVTGYTWVGFLLKSYLDAKRPGPAPKLPALMRNTIVRDVVLFCLLFIEDYIQPVPWSRYLFFYAYLIWEIRRTMNSRRKISNNPLTV